MRDGALLAVGLAGALRRSELVGLDWMRLGDGSGFIVLDERGIAIKLMTSKSSQVAAVDIVIPRADAPAVCRALDAWASFAQLEPGQPVFHGVDRHGNILPTRLGTKTVSFAVKRRMKRLEHRRGKNSKDAQAAVALCSGHSLRAGFATSAAAANVPAHRIQSHTRHASVDVLNGYIRENDQWTKSALRGWGF